MNIGQYVDLTKKMAQWRNGELSDSEVLLCLLEAHAEVISVMRETETKKAEELHTRLHLDYRSHSST